MLDFCVTGCFRYLSVLRTLAVPRPAHSGCPIHSDIILPNTEGLYEYRKQPITTKLPKTTENNLKIPKTTSFFHLKTVFIVPQYICANI